MAEDINPGLIANAIGGSGGSTDDIRKKLILAMLQQGTSGEPVQHWTQGLDRVGKALLGSLQLREMDRADAEFRRGERDYHYDRLGIRRDGAAPPGAVPTSGPRPPGAPPLVNLPPMDEEPRPTPSRPPGSFPPDPRSTAGLTSIDGLPYASAGMQRAAQNELAQGLAAGQQGAVEPVPPLSSLNNALMADRFGFGGQSPVADPSAPIVPNAVRTVSIPRPSPEQAFTGPQAPAGAPEPPMAPPAPPAVVPRPPTPPAPLAAQVAQARPEMTNAQKREAIDRYLHPRTSAPTRALIAQDFKPEEWKHFNAGDKAYLFNPRTKQVIEAADASKPTPQTQNFDALNKQRVAAGLEPYRTQEEAEGAATTAKEITQGVTKQFVERSQRAAASASTIPLIHDARTALDQGAITGSTASFQTTLQKVGALFGLSADQASNTEFFRVTVGNQVLENIKKLGANPSNVDRAYIEKVMGGEIALEEKTLRRILDAQEFYARKEIREFNRQSQGLKRQSPGAYRSIEPFLNVEEPGPYKPPAPRAPGGSPPAPQQGGAPQRGQGRVPQEGDTATGPGGVQMILHNGKWERLL